MTSPRPFQCYDSVILGLQSEVTGLWQEFVGEILWPAMCRKSEEKVTMFPLDLNVRESIRNWITCLVMMESRSSI